jgi:hypothetical protein
MPGPSWSAGDTGACDSEQGTSVSNVLQVVLHGRGMRRGGSWKRSGESRSSRVPSAGPSGTTTGAFGPFDEAPSLRRRPSSGLRAALRRPRQSPLPSASGRPRTRPRGGTARRCWTRARTARVCAATDRLSMGLTRWFEPLDKRQLPKRLVQRLPDMESRHKREGAQSAKSQVRPQLAEDTRFELVRGCPQHASQLVTALIVEGRVYIDLARYGRRTVGRILLNAAE